jgi:hypothetical protein
MSLIGILANFAAQTLHDQWRGGLALRTSTRESYKLTAKIVAPLTFGFALGRKSD